MMPVVLVFVVVIVGLFVFLLKWHLKENQSWDSLYPRRRELYPDANVCREFYRTKLDFPASKNLRIIVECPKCSKPLVALIKATYHREGKWVIRTRPLRCKVSCPSCSAVFSGRTEGMYLSPPPTVEIRGPAPESPKSAPEAPGGKAE